MAHPFHGAYRPDQATVFFMKHNIPTIQDELNYRSLSDGVLPNDHVVILAETIHLLENNEGLTYSELYEIARNTGIHAKDMKWRLACLAVMGIAKTGKTKNTVPTWFINNNKD
jgi:hypothetical protein